ncbi:Tyrosyl-DNA phosphodiesterase 2 [Nymphon striatum]|nr:Tyrosyl-DNA phosphodiesterase 2 [Nymphon striatum]
MSITFIEILPCSYQDSNQAVTASIASLINLEGSSSAQNSLEEPPSSFKFITWNIDGLDNRNIDIRTKAVCTIIEREKPDLVHLQEVTIETLPHLKRKLHLYEFLQPEDASYFVVTLIRKSTADIINHHVIDFPDTLMERNILCSKIKIGKAVINSMNTHLESTRDHAEQRKVQLKIAFDAISKIDSSENVIFAGDMNLRDTELNEVGLPDTMEDVWNTCGTRKECKFTWDASRNVNIQISSKYKPRCRFDRLYFRRTHPNTAAPSYFGLVGIERIKHTQCFPSDHWGLLSTFDIV